MDREKAAAEAAKLESALHDEAWDQLQNRLREDEAARKAAGPLPADEPKQSMEDLAAELKRHPFFATTPEDIAAAENTPELEALRALAYEGTRAEVAENFREQGNDAAKLKDWLNAKEFYNKALAALKLARRPDELADLKGQGQGWEQREMATERDLCEKCLSNRALCHLNLKNYRSCSLDCVAALKIQPSNVKAHYRLAQALLALGKLDEALKACIAGLVVDPNNASLAQNKEAIIKVLELREKKEADRKAREERTAQQDKVLKAAIVARELRTRTTPNPPDLEDAGPSLVPDPLDPTSSLVLPLLILYPLHSQTDFVKQFGEDQTLPDHLDYLLPLPWDEKHEYSEGKKDKTDAFLETAEGGLVKWGKKVELLRVLITGKVEIVDNVVTVNIIPKTRTTEWLAEFKKRKGIRTNV